MIDAVIVKTKTPINLFLSTFFRIISSGREIPLTDIRKARAVPTGRQEQFLQEALSPSSSLR